MIVCILSGRIIYFDGNASTEMPKDTFLLDLTDEGTEGESKSGSGFGFPGARRVYIMIILLARVV